MARIALQIEDATTRLLLHAMMGHAGHELVQDAPDLVIADSPQKAVLAAGQNPTLLLSPAGEVGEAVRAMELGVYGYVLLPLQPGEAPLMVARALAHRHSNSERSASAQTIPSLEMLEREHILRVLRVCRGNQARAAQMLGIGRNTLWRKLRKYAEEKSD